MAQQRQCLGPRRLGQLPLEPPAQLGGAVAMAGLADQGQQLWRHRLWGQQLLLVLLKPPAQQPHGSLGRQLIAEHHQQFRIDGDAAGFDRRQPGLQIKGGLAPQPLQPAPAFRTVEGGKLAWIHGRGAAKTGSS